jgi:FtsP/CotA-like multicopper oxidase with cupredoxin domain
LFCPDRGLAADAGIPRVVTHENRAPAGAMKDGVLTIDLEIRKGEWYPEAEDGPHIGVYAFAELGKAPSIPGPLVRVPQGTKIKATVKNLLKEPMVLHGFFTRPGDDAPVTLAADEEKQITFDAGRAGTYFYWAGAPTSTLAGTSTRYSDETQLSGAFIVDGLTAKPDERVFVIGLWRDFDDRENPTLAGLKEFAVINGKAWPYTERLKFRIGEETTWHWINATTTIHPMHMHGSYFEVLSRGDWQRDGVLKPEMRPQVVTDLMQPGKTMTVHWVPATPGHWLFHCHLMAHLDPKFSLSGLQGRIHGHELHSGMVGLVLALEVEGTPKLVAAAYKQPRKLSLVIEAAASDPLQVRLELRDGRTAAQSNHLLGPPIVLHRGEPTEITVINHLAEPTAIHWHGMELESYYDGVPDFTGMGKRMTPKIPPGGQFVARMTPPRAGTFIYHTHWHDIEQLRGGLNGTLVVVDDRYDPSSDQVFVVAFGPDDNAPLILNGSGAPAPLQWIPGKTYHLRFINIGPNIPVRLSLVSGGGPLKWKAVGKDGMELPEAQRAEGAASQLVAVGETYDFEVRAPASGDMVMRAFIAAGRGIIPELTVEQTIRLSSDQHIAASRP